MVVRYVQLSILRTVVHYTVHNSLSQRGQELQWMLEMVQHNQTIKIHKLALDPSLDSKTGMTISVPHIPIFKAIGDLMLHKNAVNHIHR